jgi:tetratricopeptide (TPR) repeat protein
MAHYRRGNLLMDQFQRDDEALREFEAAQAEPGGNEYAAVAKARIAVLKGDLDAALKLLDAAAPTAAHVGDFYYIRGYIRSVHSSSQFDPKQAMEDLTRAIEMEPTAVAFMNRGALKVNRHDWKGAEADLSRALLLWPLAQGYFNRGLAREGLGESEGAIEDLTEALRQVPANAVALAVRGRVRALMGDLDGGLEDCERAVAIREGCIEARVIRGDLRRAKRLFKEAIADYTRAIEIDPNLPQAFTNRGAARIGLGDFEGAIRDQTQAIALLPTLAEAYAARAEASMYLSEGRPKEIRSLHESAERDVVKAMEMGGGEWGFRESAREFLKQIRKRLGKQDE